MEQHSFNKKINGLPYLICSKCGLISLKNEFSRWCIQQGCDYQSHPQFLSKKKQFTGK